MIEAIIGFGAVLLLVLMRMPIAFAMGLVGMLGYWYVSERFTGTMADKANTFLGRKYRKGFELPGA